MIPRALRLIGFLLAMAAVFAWAPPARAVEPPPAKTLAALVDRIRMILPQGWSVEEELATGAVVVSRDQKVSTIAVPPSAAAMEPEPEKQIFAYCFRLAPLVESKEFRRLFKENQKSRQELNHLQEEIFRVINTRREDGLILPPASEKNLALVVRYEQVRKTFHRLPDFYFEDASVWSVYPNTPWVVDGAIRRECAEVRAKIEGLLSRYAAQ